MPALDYQLTILFDHDIFNTPPSRLLAADYRVPRSLRCRCQRQRLHELCRCFGADDMLSP